MAFSSNTSRGGVDVIAFSMAVHLEEYKIIRAPHKIEGSVSSCV